MNKINEALDNLYEVILANPEELSVFTKVAVVRLKDIAVNTQRFQAAVVLRDEEKRRNNESEKS